MMLKYQLTEEDYIRYNQYIMWRSPIMKKVVLILRIIVVISAVTVIAMEYKADRAWVAYIPIIVFGIVGYLVMPAAYRLVSDSMNRQLLKGRFKDVAGVPMYVELKDDLLLVSSRGSERRIDTAQIEAVIELPTLLLMKIKNNSHLIMPKQGVAGIDKVKEELKQLCNKLAIMYQYAKW